MSKILVLYGSAVQDARNRLRSAQISTMFEVLRFGLYSDSTAALAKSAKKFITWVKALTPIDTTGQNYPSQYVRSAGMANNALARAQARCDDFVSSDGDVQDVFALGDILRYLGEYIEFGGGVPGNNLTTLNTFRDGLRNQIAFNKRANRARVPIPDYDVKEWPDLGIFKNQLLDRSTVKFMERYYGPYIGADISGTTTDALDVLAWYFAAYGNQEEVTNAKQMTGAASAITKGTELGPIATMVLQYHHSLIECGLALALPSTAMNNDSAIASFDLYNYYTLTNGSDTGFAGTVAAMGNSTLKQDLGNMQLVVVRDLIDIADSPYADVEIALLVPSDKASTIFQLDAQYENFANKRQALMFVEENQYARGDPSLISMASDHFVQTKILNLSVGDLVQMNSVALSALKGEKDADDNQLVFDDLDKAIAAQNAMAQPAPQQVQAMAASSSNKLQAPEEEAAVTKTDLRSRLKAHPEALAALADLLG